MAAAAGMMAMRLARTSFAGIDHDGLKPGEWRPLKVDEMRKMKQIYGVPQRVRAQTALFMVAHKVSERRRAATKARSRKGKRR